MKVGIAKYEVVHCSLCLFYFLQLYTFIITIKGDLLIYFY